MRSRQHESGEGVIEGRRIPRACGVALRTIVIEIAGDVIRIRNTCEIRLMTGITIGRKSRVDRLTVYLVTLGTGNDIVPPRQGKSGDGMIGKCGMLPFRGRDRVAL